VYTNKKYITADNKQQALQRP